MPPKKTSEGESTVSSKGGKITIHIPLSSFIKEHKNLTNILQSGVQDAILAEAESQRKELEDIIAKVREIKGMEEKPKAKIEVPMPRDLGKLEPPDLRKLQPKMSEAEKFKMMKEGMKYPYGKAPEGIPQALWDERQKMSSKK
jgi:hypothetical protein